MSLHRVHHPGLAKTAAATAAILILGACGGGEPDQQPQTEAPAQEAAAPSAGSFDPCALLSEAEVEAAVGWKPATIEPITRGELGSCDFKAPQVSMREPPREVEAGVSVCPTNMPCTELPDFKSSAEMAEYRRKGYEGTSWGEPNIAAIEGLGVPAIEHELAGLRSVEMFIGNKKLAYVTTWAASEPTRALAEKVLARAK